MKNVPEKEQKELFTRLKKDRSKAKTVNFSAQYGVGQETLSRNSGLPLKEAKKLLEIYWKRNWAVKEVAKRCKVKTVNGQKWLYNPVSGFWVTLRSEKDRFSSLVQSSGVFVFDTWLKYLRHLGFRSCLQMHDETLGNVSDRKENEALIAESIKKVNEELKLNIQIRCSSSYGKDYSQCH